MDPDTIATYRDLCGPSQHYSFLNFHRRLSDPVDPAKLEPYKQFLLNVQQLIKELRKDSPICAASRLLSETSSNIHLEAPFRALFALELQRMLRITHPDIYVSHEFPLMTKRGSTDIAIIYCPLQKPFLTDGLILAASEAKVALDRRDWAQHDAEIIDVLDLNLGRGHAEPCYGLLFDKNTLRFRAGVPVAKPPDNYDRMAICNLGEIPLEVHQDVHSSAHHFLCFMESACEALGPNGFSLTTALAGCLPVRPESHFEHLGPTSCLLDDRTVVKAFDDTLNNNVTRPEQPNLELYKLAWGEEDAKDVHVERIERVMPDGELSTSVSLLYYPFWDGSHTPTSILQFAEICEQVGRVHAAGWVHSDLREGNFVFSPDGSSAWVIDFDLAGEVGTKYPRGFYSGLGCRHPDAKRKLPRKVEHDRFALRHLFELWFKGDMEEESYLRQVEQQLMQPEGFTLQQIAESIYNECSTP